MGFILEAKQIKSFCSDFRQHSHAKLIARSISFGNKLPEDSGNFKLPIAVLKGFKAWVKSVFRKYGFLAITLARIPRTG